MLEVKTDFRCIDCGSECGSIRPLYQDRITDCDDELMGFMERGVCDGCWDARTAEED